MTKLKQFRGRKNVFVSSVSINKSNRQLNISLPKKQLKEVFKNKVPAKIELKLIRIKKWQKKI